MYLYISTCSLVQSLFYVLCFRLPQLMGAENGKFDTLKFDMRLDDIVRCALNPLKVIDQKIANKFMTLAVKHKFITWKVCACLWRSGIGG